MKPILKLSIPFLLLFGLLFLLSYELFFAKPREIKTALLGQNLPAFNLPTINPPQQFTERDLLGKVSLLTIWATWCEACEYEQPMLMTIKEQYHIPIYSIAYKDNPIDAQLWLRKHGNPYTVTACDKSGSVAIDFGIYGVPESFLVNKDGKIIYRHSGVIDQKVWEQILFPLVQRYAAN